MIEMVRALYPLDRTLVSDGQDEALRLIGTWLPAEAGYQLETYAPTEKVWTWRVPERYVVHEAYLEDELGRRFADYAVNPLHLVSYSPSIDKWVTWEELIPHLHQSDERPHAIPWRYNFYERDWGFCVSKAQCFGMSSFYRYHAVIRSEFVTDPDKGLRVGVASIPGDLPGELILLAHTCHPRQANDDAAGVAVLVEVARRLAADPPPSPHMGVRFLFGPETIGSVCYLSQHPEIVGGLKAGIFVEMAGTEGDIRLQASYDWEAGINTIAGQQLYGDERWWRTGPYRSVICNDEMVVNGPGVGVPCISLSRWPYPEYHTSDDTPEIIRPEKLAEMADVVERIARTFVTSYTPRRKFTGPLFLSGYGLYDAPLTFHQKEMVMMALEGDKTLWQISEEAGADYWQVRAFVELLRERGLVEVVS